MQGTMGPKRRRPTDRASTSRVAPPNASVARTLVFESSVHQERFELFQRYQLVPAKHLDTQTMDDFGVCKQIQGIYQRMDAQDAQLATMFQLMQHHFGPPPQ